MLPSKVSQVPYLHHVQVRFRSLSVGSRSLTIDIRSLLLVLLEIEDNVVFYLVMSSIRRVYNTLYG